MEKTRFWCGLCILCFGFTALPAIAQKTSSKDRKTARKEPRKAATAKTKHKNKCGPKFNRMVALLDHQSADPNRLSVSKPSLCDLEPNSPHRISKKPCTESYVRSMNNGGGA